MLLLSYAVMGIGLVFLFFGLIGLFKPSQDFYFRILVASKIDTVGVLTFSIGLILRHGFSYFSGKVILIMIIMFVLSPLVSHLVAKTAYESEKGESVNDHR